MSKNSLLEVDFEHLAWTPVAHKIIDSLPGAIKPTEMARGKNDVYLKADWVATTPEQIRDVSDFKKLFDEIDGEEDDKGGISSKFLPSVGKNFEKEHEVSKSPEPTNLTKPEAPKKENIQSAPKSKESIDDMLKSIDLGDEEIDDSEIDFNNIPDEIAQAEKIDYVPDEKYNYYVVNLEDKSIDSGWKDEESAKNRVLSIEGNGAEGYSVEKYSTKLFKIVGDPTTVDWSPYGAFNFYVYDVDSDTIDSGHDDEASANNRIKEIKELLKENDEIESDYEIINQEKALEKFGLGITIEATWEPVEELVKKVEQMRSDALMESVLTELEAPQVKDSLGKMYLIFNFSEDFDPNDTSNRNGSSEEYFERDLFLNKIISEDGSTQVTSKELKKAADRINLQRPYQKLIKLLNHTSEYLYDNLGFGETVDKYSNIKNRANTGYDPKSDEVDQYPAAKLSNKYISAIEDIGSELKSKNSDAMTALAAMGIAFRDLAKDEENITNEIKDIIDSGEAKEEISSNEYVKKIIEIIKAKWDSTSQHQMINTLDKIIIPYVLELEDEQESSRIYNAIIKVLETDPAEAGRISNNPFNRVNEVDPTNVGKARKANIPTPATNIGASGLPILFNKKLKEYNNKVAEVISDISNDTKLYRNYSAVDGSKKKKMVADEYYKKYGTHMSNDFKDIRDEHKTSALSGSHMNNPNYDYQTIRK